MARSASVTGSIPFEVQVQAGLVPGWSIIVVNGHNEAQAQLKTILSPGNATEIVAPAALLATPAIVSVASTDATNADDATGTGANTITVIGLDGNGDAQTEVISLHASVSQTAVAGLLTFSAVNSLVVATTGAGLENVGTIWCGTGTFTSGVPAVGLASIQIGENFANTGVYTVATNHEAYFRNVMASADGSAAWKGAEFDIHITSAALAKELGLFSIHLGDGAALASADLLITKLTAGQQVILRSDVLAQTAACSARIDGYLRDLGAPLHQTNTWGR